MITYIVMCPTISPFPLFYSSDLLKAQEVMKSLAKTIDADAHDVNGGGIAYWHPESSSGQNAFIYLSTQSANELLEDAHEQIKSKKKAAQIANRIKYHNS